MSPVCWRQVKLSMNLQPSAPYIGRFVHGWANFGERRFQHHPVRPSRKPVRNAHRLKAALMCKVPHRRMRSQYVAATIQRPGQVQQGDRSASRAVCMCASNHVAIETETRLLQRHETEFRAIHSLSPSFFCSTPSRRYFIAIATLSREAEVASTPGHGRIPNPTFCGLNEIRNFRSSDCR
jgi:hypothetical protein